AAALYQAEVAAAAPQRTAARFWLGKLALSRGDTADAEAAWVALAHEDSIGYYGLRARREVALPPLRLAAPPPPPPPPAVAAGRRGGVRARRRLRPRLRVLEAARAGCGGGAGAARRRGRAGRGVGLLRCALVAEGWARGAGGAGRPEGQQGRTGAGPKPRTA